MTKNANKKSLLTKKKAQRKGETDSKLKCQMATKAAKASGLLCVFSCAIYLSVT